MVSWPLVVDALDALFSLLELSPREAGIAVPSTGDVELRVAVTAATSGRPSLRVLYQIEEEAGRVVIQNVAMA